MSTPSLLPTLSPVQTVLVVNSDNSNVGSLLIGVLVTVTILVVLIFIGFSYCIFKHWNGLNGSTGNSEITSPEEGFPKYDSQETDSWSIYPAAVPISRSVTEELARIRSSSFGSRASVVSERLRLASKDSKDSKDSFRVRCRSISINSRRESHSPTPRSTRLSSADLMPLDSDWAAPIVPWKELKLDGDATSSSIGQGSFGKVLRAVWTRGLPRKHTVVAIKVMSKYTNASSIEARKRAQEEAQRELLTMKAAEECVMFKPCIVKAYGCTTGKAPKEVCDALNLSENCHVLGLVLHYERGGSLHTLVHNRPLDESTGVTKPLPLVEKLRLLAGVARGLAELHAAGIVHADVKPENVLLSGDTPPEPRLADFGVSIIPAGSDALSSFHHTPTVRGTALYRAPEMVYNPYNDINATNNSVAQPSRKTDIYSFAILCWEVLSEQRPFAHVKRGETELASILHMGHRPDLSVLPPDCPIKVRRMIESCWSADRAQRRSASECFSLLHFQHGLLEHSLFAVFLSCASIDTQQRQHNALAACLFHRLTQLGYSVCMSGQVSVCSPVLSLALPSPSDPNTGPWTASSADMGSASPISTQNPVPTPPSLFSLSQFTFQQQTPTTRISLTSASNKSQRYSNSNFRTANNSGREQAAISSSLSDRSVSTSQAQPLQPEQHPAGACETFLFLANRDFEQCESCMKELRVARQARRPVVALMLEPLMDWAGPEFLFLSQLSGAEPCPQVDLSGLLVGHDWAAEDGPSTEAWAQLRTKVDELMPLLPALNQSSGRDAEREVLGLSRDVTAHMVMGPVKEEDEHELDSNYQTTPRPLSQSQHRPALPADMEERASFAWNRQNSEEEESYADKYEYKND